MFCVCVCVCTCIRVCMHMHTYVCRYLWFDGKGEEDGVGCAKGDIIICTYKK